MANPRAGSFLTSIDYAKAFNRLDFNHCLKSLQANGACKEILAIISSFLTNRRMTVKIGTSFSQPRIVLGGVPQGSLLGVMLFNLSIDNFEAGSPDVADYGRRGKSDDWIDNANIMPVPPEQEDRDYRHLPAWRVELLQVPKYVDDNVINETTLTPSAPLVRPRQTCSQEPEFIH